jgi:hypothetical protein
MNERRPRKASPIVERHADEADHPRYLGERARGILRRAVHLAVMPLSVARAVIHRLRERD